MNVPNKPQLYTIPASLELLANCSNQHWLDANVGYLYKENGSIAMAILTNASPELLIRLLQIGRSC